MEPTQQQVKALFSYNPKTGALIHKTAAKGTGCHNRAPKGESAIYGTPGKSAAYMRVLNKSRSASKICYLWYYGYIPTWVQHVDRNSHNLAINNLLDVPRTMLQQHSGNSSANTSGVRGVHQVYNVLSDGSKSFAWYAVIRHDGKEYYLKRTKDFTEAVAHRYAAEQAFDRTSIHSPAYKYMKRRGLAC